MMNDELSALLTETWAIPQYAQSMLWLDTESGSTKCEGKHGLFQLDTPAEELTILWGGEKGAPLKQIKWQPDNLQWDGTVALGGMVEMVHITELADLELPIAVIYFSGQPLRSNTKPYPTAEDRHHVKIPVPHFETAIDDSFRPAIVTLLTLEDSPLVGYAQSAMTQNVPLHIYGRLADEEQGWHNFFAMPILWESVSLFAP